MHLVSAIRLSAIGNAGAKRGRTLYMYATKFHTKQGNCILVWSERGLCAIVLPNTPLEHNRYRLCSKTPDWVEQAKAQIIRFFEGNPDALESLKKIKLDYGKISPFRMKVYEQLRKVKAGQVTSYRDLAEAAGAPGAARAVGTAMAKNPFPLIVPCHRVIKSDGSSGAYSALAGTKSKEELLKMERKGQRAQKSPVRDTLRRGHK